MTAQEQPCSETFTQDLVGWWAYKGSIWDAMRWVLPPAETERPLWEFTIENRAILCVIGGPLLFQEFWARAVFLLAVGRDRRRCMKDILNSMTATGSGAGELLDILATVVGTHVSMRITGVACFHVSTLDRNSEQNTDTLTLLASICAREIKWAPWVAIMECMAQDSNSQDSGTQPQVIATPSPRPQPWRSYTPCGGKRGQDSRAPNRGVSPKAKLSRLKIGWNTRHGATPRTRQADTDATDSTQGQRILLMNEISLMYWELSRTPRIRMHG